jgi:hypothetical protein
VQLDDGWLVAAALWHGTGMAATLPWHEDGTCGPEPLLAKAPLHHAIGIANAVLRHLPAPLIVAIASTRAPPSPGREKELCGYLQAGSILALGRPDAVPCPSLDREAARPPIEAYLSYAAEADAAFTESSWGWYQSQVGTGWASFEALEQDGSDVARWYKAQQR